MRQTTRLKFPNSSFPLSLVIHVAKVIQIWVCSLMFGGYLSMVSTEGSRLGPEPPERKECGTKSLKTGDLGAVHPFSLPLTSNLYQLPCVSLHAAGNQDQNLPSTEYTKCSNGN